jgi:predicted amidohydrolase
VYEQGDVCVGILICMDIDHPDFSISVIERVKSSSSRIKILCVPADMGSEWLQGQNLPFPKKYEGVYFILCNNIQTHQLRCKSFIADTTGKKLYVQEEIEPLFAQIP